MLTPEEEEEIVQHYIDLIGGDDALDQPLLKELRREQKRIKEKRNADA